MKEHKIPFQLATVLMDDEIREQLHNTIAPCSAQEFFSAYEKAHEQKYGEQWELSKANPVF